MVTQEDKEYYITQGYKQSHNLSKMYTCVVMFKTGPLYLILYGIDGIIIKDPDLSKMPRLW